MQGLNKSLEGTRLSLSKLYVHTDRPTAVGVGKKYKLISFISSMGCVNKLEKSREKDLH